MPFGYVCWSVICELLTMWAAAVCNSICFTIGYRVWVPVVLPSLITYKKGPCFRARLSYFIRLFVRNYIRYFTQGLYWRNTSFTYHFTSKSSGIVQSVMSSLLMTSLSLVPANFTGFPCVRSL